jgi:hypothetical protein
MGCLWCSKDPIDPNVRWIVRKTDGMKRFEVTWAKFGIENKIAEMDFLEEAQWKAVTSSIEHISHKAYDLSMIGIEQSLIDQSRSFLENLSNGK